MRIGDLDLGPRPLFLAPMEDVSDPPFRILCKRLGADVLTTEFISAGGLLHGAASSVQKLEFYDEERPVAIQIYGGEAVDVGQAAAIADTQAPDIVDINFGCPVKKVVCHDGGAGVLRNIGKMEAITAAVVANTTRPVSVKTRLGWDDASINVLDVARMLESVGVQSLAIHARTRAQMYRGEARWEWFGRIRDALHSIPLVGNGDAATPARVQQMFALGVDGVMIGRGAIGNPWIFREAKALLETGETLPGPTWDERIETVAEHVALKAAWLGERKGVLEMRRMYGGYFKGHAGASRLRTRLMTATDTAGVLEILLNTSEADAQAADAPATVAVRRAMPAGVTAARLPRPARLPVPASA